MSEELHTTEEWVKILKRQEEYTREYRHNLYKKIDVKTKKNILDIGCGTGAITADIASLTDGQITGVDIDDKKLNYAKTATPAINFMAADVVQLPFRDETFDLVVVNVVLIHITEQQKAVKEMARVVQKGGIVLAALEPDYAGTLHYPENEVHCATLKYMEEKGVNLTTGRRLKFLFRKAGLQTEIGVCAVTLDFVNKTSEEQLKDFCEQFGETEKFLSKIGWTEQQIKEYKQESCELIENDLAFSFIPAFYAIGRK